MAILGLLAVLCAAIGVHGAALTNDWAAWRGPLANGVSATANPPVTWSETNNVRWKIEVPGKGHSS
ncbi:MAG TPA: hypothetical protein VM680_09400, partial [Verrucomicrobiae bacterium]|nr:hypothetical protein [Verrucomicrobiae bacterium]